MELQTIHGLAAESATLHAKVNRLRNPFQSLGCDTREVVMLAQDLRSMQAASEIVRTGARMLKERNIESENYVRKKG